VSWWAWAIILVFQNFAFTFVSRARNSGSIMRHAVAAVFSNGIFFIQFAFMTEGIANAAMHGYLGHLAQIAITLFYTVFTVIGSLTAHTYSLRSEKGKSAVGANKKFAQFTAEEGEELRRVVAAFKTEVLTSTSFGEDGLGILAELVDLYREKQKALAALERQARLEQAPDFGTMTSEEIVEAVKA
jgi:hypothetical protein